jgi:hypothetical protein
MALGDSIGSGVVITGRSIAYSFRKVKVRVYCGGDSSTIADLGVICNSPARPRQLTRPCSRPPSARKIVAILRLFYAARLQRRLMGRPLGRSISVTPSDYALLDDCEDFITSCYNH